MLKLIPILFILIITPLTIHAADVSLQWDPSPGATGYKIYKSTDQGATWQTPVDVGNNTTYTYPNVEEDTLVLFRASAYNQAAESIRTWSGAWYDHRLIPIATPSGTGVK